MHILPWLATTCLLISTAVHAAEPLPVYEGEGVALHVLSLSDDKATLTGELIKGEARWPFTGQSSTQDGVETLKGVFTVKNVAYPFTLTRRAGENTLTFATGNATHTLRPRPAIPAPPVPAGETVKFTTAEFRDINMGNVVSHTMLIPDGFTPEGHIEWNNERTPYPQTKIKISAADKSQITFAPAMNFLYWDWTDAAKAQNARMGFAPPATNRGTPPPAEISAWVMEVISKNPTVTGAKLISDDRDKQIEMMMAQNDPGRGVAWEHHRIQYTYQMEGIAFTEEFTLAFARTAPSVTQNMITYLWAVYPNSIVRAPSARWPALRPILYASVQSLRTVPQWFTQSQGVIMEITRNNHIDGMRAIAARAAEYDKMRDADMAAWRRKNQISDKQQDARINQIYEVDNFAGHDGEIRKLPSGYKHYWSNGKGAFIMSNTGEAPGSEWKPAEPLK